MDFPSIFGLPAHPLIVHATVVLVPLAAVAVLLHAFVPAARARLGLVTVLSAAVAVVLVPLSTSSGEQLRGEVGRSALVARHAELADGLLPWVIGLFVVAALLTVRDRLARRRASEDTSPRSPRPVRLLTHPVLVGVLAAVAFVGTTQQVVRIGHSGAQAAWHGVAAGQHRGGQGSGDTDGH